MAVWINCLCMNVWEKKKLLSVFFQLLKTKTSQLKIDFSQRYFPVMIIAFGSQTDLFTSFQFVISFQDLKGFCTAWGIGQPPLIRKSQDIQHTLRFVIFVMALVLGEEKMGWKRVKLLFF